MKKWTNFILYLVEDSVAELGKLVHKDAAGVTERLPSVVPVGQEGVGDLGEVAPSATPPALLGEGPVAVKGVGSAHKDVRGLR